MEIPESKPDANFEEILFEIDQNSVSVEDLQKDLQTKLPVYFGSPNLTPEKSRPRFQDYIVREEEEILTLTCFEDNALRFIFEDHSFLKIKDSKSTKLATDKDLIKLQSASNKLVTFNQTQKVKEPEGLWKRIHDSISGLFRTAKKIPKHLRITKLMVNLNDCAQIGDEGLKSLIDFIKHFENLTHLEFEVKNTGATDYCIGMICALLGSLKHLTYFYIDFSGCKITDESMFFLANAINTKANLEEIWLRFSWCQHDVISNEAIQALSKSLENCKKLKVLLLEFNGQTQISSKGVSAILNSIKEKKRLQRLYLYFEKSQVNDNFLNFTAKALPKLKKLQVFGLNLAHSNFLTKKGFESLGLGLKPLGLKTGLYLYLNGCLGTLEKEKVKKFIHSLIEKKKVKNYVIEFD